MKLAWSLSLSVLAILLATGFASAESNAHLTYGDCGKANEYGSSIAPNVASVWADGDTLYLGRTDGYVQAVDRANGNVRWTYPTAFQPQESVRDVTGDGNRIYIAYSETENGGADPIVILDKNDGSLFKRIKPWENQDLPDDPFRLLVDGPFLYAGMNGGSIVKINKNTGIIETFAGTNSPIIFRPQLHLGTDQPNGIYAMTIQGSTLIAARNFGHNNDTVEEAVSFRHFNNSILVLNKGDLSPVNIPPQTNETFGEYKLRDDEGLPHQWGVFALHPDSGGNDLWVGASAWRFWYTSQANGADWYADRAMVARFNIGPAALTEVLSGVLSHGDEPDGAATYVAVTGLAESDSGEIYASTTATAGGSAGGVVQTLNKGDLSMISSHQPGHGDIMDLYVDGDGTMFTGHQCVVASGAPSIGMAMEMADPEAPTIKLLSPSGGDHIPGRVRIAYDASGDLPLTARVYVSEVGGECDDGTSCYRSLESMGVPEGRFTITDEFVAQTGYIDIPVPDGFGARLKIVVEDALGRTGQDFGEAAFTVDREPPVILSRSPAHNDIITTRSPTLQIVVRDELSQLSTTSTQFWLNGRTINDFEFDQNGINIQMGSGNDRLKQGYNEVEGVIADVAGNVVSTGAWTILVDDNVQAPTITPLTGGWVRDTRPTFTATFAEDVDLVSFTFNNQDVTEQVSIPPRGINEGSKIHFQPTQDLDPRLEYTLAMQVTDAAGNVGGPAGEFQRNFRVDAEDPFVGGLQPLPGMLLTNSRPTITFSTTDAGAGIDAESVAFFLDGEDLTSNLERLPDRYRYEVANPLADGNHELVVAVTDLAGNRITRSWDFDLDLTRPEVSLVGFLPGEQTAVKQGDKVRLQVQISDNSDVRNPTIDARGLDSSLSSRVAPVPVAGQPGLYEWVVDVKESRTRTVTITATAEDIGGHIGLAGWQVLIDNNPPVTTMDALPEYVGKTFQLKWENNPNDKLVGGSGVAYYSLERKVGNEPWQVIRPRLETDRIDMEATEDPFTRVSFRVTAVDRAGNEQQAPSNVVETITRGDPFDEVRFPPQVAAGTAYTFAATPRDTVPLDDSVVFVRITDADGNELDQDLGRFGRLYTGAWNVTGAEPGDYLLRYHFRDSEGFEMISQTYTLRVLDANEAEGLASASGQDKDTPAAWWLPVVAASMAVLLRRKEDST